MTQRVFTTTMSTAAIGALVPAGCSSPEENTDDANSAEQSTLSPTEQYEADAGVTVEPGFASCQVNNTLADQAWDGSGEYSAGTLDTAEIQETEDAYEVTMTGDFIDPEVLLTEDSRLSFTLQLMPEQMDQGVALETEYDAGETVFTGVTTTDTEVQQETHEQLESGTFTATYPKDTTELENLDPTMWVASVYFDEGAPRDANPDDINSPMTFRCDDGRNWTWQALDAQ